MDGLIQKNKRMSKKMMNFGYSKEKEKKKALSEINIV